MPAELRAALDGDLVADAAFRPLPPSHQREYVRWISNAKQSETRQRRAAQALERLKATPAREPR